MAVTYLSTTAGNYIVLCLSSDTKPSSTANAILFETDTAKKYKPDGGTGWTLVEGAGGSVAWGDITGALSDQTDLQAALDGKQVAGTYATGTGSATGTNTGDQTSIVGITGTTAQFNTALSDNDFATLAGNESLTNKSVNGVTLSTGAGTTVFLRGDGTYTTVSATQPDIPLSLLSPSVDETITSGYSAILSNRYTIASTKRTTIGIKGRLKII